MLPFRSKILCMQGRETAAEYHQSQHFLVLMLFAATAQFDKQKQEVRM